MKGFKIMLVLFFMLLSIFDSEKLFSQSSCNEEESIAGNLSCVYYDVSISNINKTTGESDWQENSNLTFKWVIGIGPNDVPPYEFGFYLNQDRYQFITFPNFFVKFEVKYDSGNWITVHDERNCITTDIIPTWNTLGGHTMDIRYYLDSGESVIYNFKINVIPSRQKLLYDGNGNYMDVWFGNSNNIDRPLIMVEGFDPQNLNNPALYYGKAANFLDELRDLDVDIIIINLADGGADIAENAQVVKDAVNYIDSIKEGNQKIILAGLSMGGVVARYALAESEENNNPLNVSHLLSIDSPQQGAVIDSDFQDFINDNDEGTPHPSLSSIAAKQMLIYNTYDKDCSDHTNFYTTLNSLNGDGYPNSCKNIGVSFSPDIINPHSGEWLTVNINLAPDEDFDINYNDAWKVAGSYLPISSTRSRGQGSILFGWGSLYWQLVRHKHPTFMPYKSSLDLIDYESKFDVIISSNGHHFHDEFPDDIIDPITYELDLQEDSNINVLFKNLINDGNNAGEMLKIIDNTGQEFIIESGQSLPLLASEYHTVETINQKRMNFQNTEINYQHHDWNENIKQYYLVKDFKGWENNGEQDAIFYKLDKITLETELLSGGNGGLVKFKDPWFKEDDGIQPGNFNPFETPFTPGSGDDGNYGGVFLNQEPDPNNPDHPYYSVLAPDMLPIIPFNGRNLEWCFLNWSGTGVDIQHSDENETAVVFQISNAELCANYRWHLASNNSRATGYNNGRRIAKGNGNILHLVYEDNGEIWYTGSSDNGKNWEKEIRISGKSSEDAYYTNPSIICSYDYGGNVHIVWECVGQTTYGDIHDIEYRRKNYDGWTETTNISSPYLFIQEKVMRPVIHAISYGDLYIVWAGYSESENKYYTYIKILDGYGQWHDIEEVPGVNGYPLISYFNAGLHKTVIIWSQDGGIKYIDGKYTSSNWVWSSIKSLTSNFNSEIHNNCNPTMSIDAYCGISYIAWEANRISDDKKCLYYCKYDLTDEAGPSPIGDLTLIDSYDNQTFNPTISWDEYDDLLTLFYQKNSKIFRSRKDGTSPNWTTKDYSYGIYPSICCNYNIGAVWTKYDDAPYMIISDWGNITGSVTWSDKIVLESNVYVESGATLTIEPGTEIKLDDDVKITIEEGGKIIANGTSSEKIKFLKSNEYQAWDKILLEGDNNEFSHCIFDGGYYNVDVRSRYNTFTNCTFKNGVRGINTYKRPQGDWSCFELSNCTFENNSNGGVVALYTYGAINSCTIKNNPGYGLYLYNARIGNNSSYGDKCGLFRENYIHNNGTYGVVLAYNGILWSGYGSNKGYNQIINNGSHEIYLQNYTDARFYDSNYGGYSSIYDQSGGRYIYNLSKTYNGEYYVAATVVAENNYWGCAAGRPSSSNFYGPVDYTPYLSSDPTLPVINVAGDDSENGGEVLSEGIVNSICSSAAGSGVSSSGQGLVDLKNKIQELRNQIDNNPDDLSNARRLNEMYSLLTDYDPEDILKEKQPLLEKIAGYRQRLLDNPSGNESVQLIGETSMLLEIYNLTEKKEYDNAMAMLNDYDKYIKNSDNRRELLSNKLAVFEDMGEYEQALAVLIDLREEVKGDHDHYTPPTYEIIEQNLKSELGIDDDPHAKGNAPENDAFDIVQKLDFALYNNYPNPFNPVTTIPFSLAENSHIKIEVFDILGRKITVLADRVYEKGSYNVNFNGNALASGLYFIRTQMKSKENGKKYSFMKKMLLMK